MTVTPKEMDALARVRACYTFYREKAAIHHPMAIAKDIDVTWNDLRLLSALHDRLQSEAARPDTAEELAKALERDRKQLQKAIAEAICAEQEDEEGYGGWMGMAGVCLDAVIATYRTANQESEPDHFCNLGYSIAEFPCVVCGVKRGEPCRARAVVPDATPPRPSPGPEPAGGAMDAREAQIAEGAYVIATKYADGDPGDPWAVGYYIGPTGDGRHLVGDIDGTSYYHNGYRRVRAGLREDAGRWLTANCKLLESSPPGMINLWGMLGDTAFEDASGRDTAALTTDRTQQGK